MSIAHWQTPIVVRNLYIYGSQKNIESCNLLAGYPQSHKQQVFFSLDILFANCQMMLPPKVGTW